MFLKRFERNHPIGLIGIARLRILENLARWRGSGSKHKLPKYTWEIALQRERSLVFRKNADRYTASFCCTITWQRIVAESHCEKKRNCVVHSFFLMTESGLNCKKKKSSDRAWKTENFEGNVKCPNITMESTVNFSNIAHWKRSRCYSLAQTYYVKAHDCCCYLLSSPNWSNNYNSWNKW